MPAPTITAKPSSTLDWTVGNTNFGSVTIEPTSGKKLTGWTPAERPSPQFMNWIFYNTDQWEKYLSSAVDNFQYRITANETSIAALGTAATVSASPSGHTYLTGANIQLQLDETDARLKALADAVTSGQGIDLVGYDVTVPSDFHTPIPTTAGSALDQLASRVKSVENASAGSDFVQQTYNDYVIPGDKPVGGVGNPGLTSNPTNNPRGLNLSELQTQWGEERIWFQKIVLTGNFDSAGRPEYSLGGLRHDKRVMFYGDWKTADPLVGDGYEDLQSVNGVVIRNKRAGDYFTVTAICDAVGLISRMASTESDQIDVQVDGVSTGIPISQRGFSGVTVENGSDQIISDNSLIALGYGIHTFKFTNGASDSNLFWDIYGMTLITTGQKQVGGSAYLGKISNNYPAAAITTPTVGPKGGKIFRYLDPADTLIKDAVTSVIAPSGTSTGTIGSGATSASISPIAGFVANALALITDGPTNWELIYINSVNTGLGQLGFATGTVNSYTNPTITLYGKIFSAANHANEKKDAFRPFHSLGINQVQDTGINCYNSQAVGSGYSQILGVTKDGVRGVLANNSFGIQGDRFLQIYSGNALGDYMYIQFKGTGLDMLFGGLTGAGAGTSQYDFTLDGVPLPRQSYTFTDPSTPQWRKICSDLPEGSHTLKLINVNNTSDVVQPVMILEYTEADPAAIVNLDRGNILSARFQPANYLFQPNCFFPSIGVLQNYVSRNVVWTNTIPNNQGWVIGQNFGEGGAVYQSNTTNDLCQKWFYGTGIEVSLNMENNMGICELKMNGNLLTASNFAGAMFQISGGGAFNSATGLIDCYTSLSVANPGKFSISGLAEGWHCLQIRTTGNKNASSTAITIQIANFWLIGHPYSDSVFNHGQMGTDSVSMGGIKDLRIFDSYNLADRTNQLCDLNSSCYNSGSLPGGFSWNMPGMSAMVETFGGDIEIETNVGIAVNGTFTFFLYIDGKSWTEEATSAPNNYTKFHAFYRIPLAPGKHFIGVRGSSGNSFESIGNHFKVREISNRNY